MKQLILVFLGGGIGSALRYGIGQYLNIPKYTLPYGTLLVNIIGSLIIGVILGLALKNSSISNNTILFIATGFCGGFTTFSAFAFENQAFLKSGDLASFAFYTITTLVIGILAVFIGIWLVRFI
jgi:CrcB protein